MFFPEEYMSPVCLTILTQVGTGLPALSLYAWLVSHHFETVGKGGEVFEGSKEVKKSLMVALSLREKDPYQIR